MLAALGALAAALYAEHRAEVALVLTDMMMPVMDGIAAAGEISAERLTPVVMLTALGEESDRVLGLETGADDYVTKPFSPREVVALSEQLTVTYDYTHHRKANIPEELRQALEAWQYTGK